MLGHVMPMPIPPQLRGFLLKIALPAAAVILLAGHMVGVGLAAQDISLEAISDVPTAKQLFETNCAGCHGTDLKGGQGPSLVDKVWIHGSGDTDILGVIANGVPAKGMPAYGSILGEPERRSLVAYIREKGASAESSASPFPTNVQTSDVEDYKIVGITKDLVTPWSIIFLSKTEMLVSERPGRLRVVHADGRVEPPVSNVPKITDEFIHGGMLGLALAPDYAKSGWIYIAYTDEQPDRYNDAARCAKRVFCFTIASQLKIIRGRLRHNSLIDQQTIWQGPAESYRVAPNFGGRLTFGADGMLYFSVGDRGYSPMEAPDVTSPNGKIHRVAPDGKIPADNPFVKTKGAIPSIWSIGHRNPQGLALDSQNGFLWSTEHGPRGGDELNLIRRGGNYGWPYLTYGMGYDGRPFDPAYPLGHSQAPFPVPDKDKSVDTSKMIEPVTHWTPSIAVSAIAFYNGAAFPHWRNNLFVTSLKQQKLLRLTVDRDKVTHEELIFEAHGRLRDIAVGPDGAMYLAVNEPDEIVKLVPATRLPKQTK